MLLKDPDRAITWNRTDSDTLQSDDNIKPDCKYKGKFHILIWKYHKLGVPSLQKSMSTLNFLKRILKCFPFFYYLMPMSSWKDNKAFFNCLQLFLKMLNHYSTWESQCIKMLFKVNCAYLWGNSAYALLL